jgi:hypothetical protein
MRCRGPQPCGSRRPARQDLAPTVTVGRGEAQVTRQVSDDVLHSRPKTLVHRDAAAHRARSTQTSRPGRRGPTTVIPAAEREADVELRLLAAPPLGL